MRMQALDAFYSTELKQVHAGEEFEIGDARGQEFEERGLAKPVGAVKAAPAHPNKMAPAPLNKAADEGPLAEAGGKTGGDKPPLSSPAAPARKTPRSRKPGAGRG